MWERKQGKITLQDEGGAMKTDGFNSILRFRIIIATATDKIRGGNKEIVQ